MISEMQGYGTISGKIIVVEDDLLMQTILVDILSDLGASCTAFVTADDALIHMMQSRETFELLVTDFTLPGQLDGRELALMVRRRWPHVPVIVTTGYGSEVGDNLPAQVAFLQKPWSVDQFVDAVTLAVKPMVG